MAKRAKDINHEDSLERQETSLELRIRIGKALKIPTPNAKQVRALLNRYENLKTTGYV